MLFGNRKPRSSAGRRREAWRPAPQGLEARCLLVGFSIDLANVASTPFGVEMSGLQAGGRVGNRVAELGDVSNDTFDDFAIASATLNTVSVVFGSKAAGGGNVNWLTLNQQQRVGDLSLLGNGTQANPINGQPGFSFDGVSFTTNDPTALVGASVAGVGDVNSDGQPDLMIGAPNADGGIGRAYLIYGGAQLQNRGTTPINLDIPPAAFRFATFVNNLPTPITQLAQARTGTSIASAGDLITDGRVDVAIGAPGASLGGVGSGAVYVLSGTFLQQTPTGTFSLQNVGQTGAGAAMIPGILFTGGAIGQSAGFSVAGAGNTSGATAGNFPTGDLLIGAPTGPGTAYLVYGSATLPTLATTTGGLTSISLSLVGGTAAGSVPGAVFTGSGDETGFAVSSAGDFNGDGLFDFMIGSPGNDTTGIDAGLVTLIYGRAATPTTPGRITGTIPLNAIPTGVQAAQFQGTGPANRAGHSLSLAGRINTDAFNEILIGAPGFIAGVQVDTGAAYLIPGNTGVVGTFPLSTATADPLSATLITNSTPGANRLGESLSSRLVPTNAAATLDSDVIADLVIGSPGFSLPASTGGTTRPAAGAAFALEGALVPLAIPTPPVGNAITVQIGIDQPFPQFVIDATTPAAMEIFIFSNNTVDPPFRPVLDIDPTTITVNGVAFPGATIRADPVDENGDGIADAIVTITPRSSLNLANGVQQITVTGRTRATDPANIRTFTGTATVRVTGGGGGGGGGSPGEGPGITFFDVAFPLANNNVPPIGERLVPTIATLSRLNWKPLPYRVAYQQFRPSKPFAFRQANFFHPIDTDPLGSRHDDKPGRTSTLGRDVFTRGRFSKDEPFRFEHQVPVIPGNLQVQGSVQRPRGSRG